jgi:hypothetical protein
VVDSENLLEFLDEPEVRLDRDADIFSARGQNIVILLGNRAVEMDPIVGPRTVRIRFVGVIFKGAKECEGAACNLVLALAEIEGARPVDALEQRERPIPIGSGDFLPFGPRGIT